MEWKNRSYPVDYNNGLLEMDGVPIQSLVSEFGSPLYVYSEKAILDSIQEFQSAAGDRSTIICYAVKANSNGALLKTMAENGLGADIVSGGELYRAIRAGVDPQKIVYSGVGKTDREIREAIRAGILLFSVESAMELEFLGRIAGEERKIVQVSIRVNPEVDAGTHPYISTGLKENKFGVEHGTIEKLYRMALDHPSLDPASIGFHIGSQLTSLSGYAEAIHKLRESIAQLRSIGVNLRYVDVGGGLGIHYQGAMPPTIEGYVKLILQSLGMPELTVIFEPGRRIVGNAGIFVSEILYSKTNGEKLFQICDGAMNDLIRPSLYSAYHEVIPVEEGKYQEMRLADLVGPICETGDFLAKDRMMPVFQPGDLVILASAGAYGSAMSSNYNSRPRVAEVLVTRSGEARLIRKRESYEDLVRLET